MAGYAAFQNQDSGRPYRTAMIFSATDPAVPPERFIGFAKSALVAFLRPTPPDLDFS